MKNCKKCPNEYNPLLHKECPHCKAERSRQWKLNNKEKNKEHEQRYRDKKNGI